MSVLSPPPSRWNEKDISPELILSEDGREVSLNSLSIKAGGPGKQAAAVRTDFPVLRESGLYYYEVTIVSYGQRGHISVGFTTADARLNRLPGWEPQSWGYHGDDGNAFASERGGTPFGPRFSTGDVVGCGIDFDVHKIFYTKNGSFLGYAFMNIGKDGQEPLFPAIGLRNDDERVRANFGQAAYRYNLEDYKLHSQADTAEISV